MPHVDPLPGQLDLFALDDIPAAAPITQRQIERDARARWTSYTGHGPCAECLAYLHAHGGIGPNPKRGRRRRVVVSESIDFVYCTEHARPLEDEDKAAVAAAKSAAQRSASAQRGAATRAHNRRRSA
jgi:hypothetical protein